MTKTPLVRIISIFVISLVLFACDKAKQDVKESKEQPSAEVVSKEETTVIKHSPLVTKEDLAAISKLRDELLDNDLGYQILESLTTEIGPRMAGSAQDPLAVKWAVAKMQSLGFDKVYTEEATYSTWIRGIETAEITAPFPQKMHITALGGSVSTPDQGLQAEVIHIKSLADLKQADASGIKNKIVFISNRMQRFVDGRGYGPAVQARSMGAIEAAKKGALAIVIRSIGTDTHRVPHTGMMRYDEKVQKIPAAALSNPDADQLERIFSRQQKVTLKLNIGSHAGLDFTSHNVIGEITGTEKADQFVIMGGHLDSWDLGTGAVDDGAGVSITMAAASLIKKAGIKPRRSIRVILWANEEQGLKGAFSYSKNNKDKMDSMVVGAESDFGAGRIYRFSSLVETKDLPFIEQMQEMLEPLGIARGNNKATPGPDLIPLYQQGMMVFRLHQDGTDYFDLHHTADDTLDKVDPKALAQNVAAYSVYALMMAQYQGDLKRPEIPKQIEH